MKIEDILKNDKVSVRLKNLLHHNFDYDLDVTKIKIIELYRCRGGGKKTVDEFINLISKIQKTDSIVESVINQFKERSEIGINKYGTTLDRNDLTALEWINHAQQEAMDFCLYLEKLKQLHNEK